MRSDMSLHLAILVAGMLLLAPPLRGEAAWAPLLRAESWQALSRAFQATVDQRATAGDSAPAWVAALAAAAGG